MPEQTASRGYLFGQSDLAALRLEKLGEIFDSASEAFLGSPELADGAQSVIDLGCGTGLTTALLASRFGAATGLDVADDFLALAASRGISGATFLRHDTTAMPLPGAPAGLIFCRFLLTHLTSPLEALGRWQSQLAPGGLFAAQEVEAIETRSEPISAYLRLLELVLNERKHELYIGPTLGSQDFGGWRVRRNGVRVHAVDGRRAAEMFAINLQVWRTAPETKNHLTPREVDELEQGLRRKASGMADQGEVVWKLRELVLEKP
jgi:trans-aconitate 2-methyltransferase